MSRTSNSVDFSKISEDSLIDLNIAEHWNLTGPTPQWVSIVGMAYYGTHALKAEVGKGLPGPPYRWSDLKEHMRVIPPEDIYPQATAYSTALLSLSEDTVWVKRPKLFEWSQECRGIRNTINIASAVRVEIEIYESLLSHGFNGVARYYGIRKEQDLAVAIILKRYPFDLNHWPLPACINKRQHMYDAIECIVERLHDLGLAHNDLNPNNVVVDEDDQPFLIDLEGCRKFGEPIRKKGTPGWNQGYVNVSATANDRVGLAALKTYLQVTDAEQTHSDSPRRSIRIAQRRERTLSLEA